MIATGISPLKKLTRPGVAIPGAGKVSNLDERLNSSLLPASPNRKRYHSPFRAQIAGTLVQELNPWIENLVYGEPLASQREILATVLRQMFCAKCVPARMPADTTSQTPKL